MTSEAGDSGNEIGAAEVLAAVQKMQAFLEEWREDRAGTRMETLHPFQDVYTNPRRSNESDPRLSGASAGSATTTVSLPSQLKDAEHRISGTPIALKQRLNNLSPTSSVTMTKSERDDFSRAFSRLSSMKLSWQQRLSGMQEMVSSAPPMPSGCLKRRIQASSFEILCTLVILCNAVFIAWSTNYDIQHFDEPTPKLHGHLELLFCVFYTLELTLRVYTWRCRYFFCPDWKWNACDVLLVVSSLQEQLWLLFARASSTSNMSFLRVLRLFKMIRVLRMVRLMRAFREFRMMLNSIGGSLKAAVWAILLIIVMSLMFCLCMVQGVTEYLKNTPDVSDAIRAEIDSCRASLPKAMLSMYMATTGGKDWSIVSDVLYTVGPGYYMIFLSYIALYSLVLTNTITSLFVESLKTIAERDTATIIADKLERQDEYARKLSSWFSKIDTEQTGEITYEQFAEHVIDPDVIAFAETLEIELVDLKQFFGVTSCNGKRAVDLKNFVLGCIKLKGMARSMDLISLIYAHRDATIEQKMMLHKFEKKCMAKLESVTRHLGRSLSEVSEVSHLSDGAQGRLNSLRV